MLLLSTILNRSYSKLYIQYIMMISYVLDSQKMAFGSIMNDTPRTPWEKQWLK